MPDLSLEVSARHALTLLTRLAARQPAQRSRLALVLRGRLEHLAHFALDVAVETGEPIGSVLADLIEIEASPVVAESILARFDEAQYRDSVALHKAVLASTRKVLSYRQDASSELHQAEAARLINNLGFSLSLVGQREEALESSRKAVEAFRQLPLDQAEHRNELAVSLINLGVAYGNLGQHNNALRATEEAVQIARRLAEEQRSPEMLPVLAQSLLNLGSISFSLGLGERALKATEDALEILRGLAAGDPGTFSANLARSLNNLGAILRSLDRFDEALTATSEGLELRRVLAESRPDAFLGDLAASLESLASGLQERESRKDEVLTLLREAVIARRRIAVGGARLALLDLVDGLEDLARAHLEAGERGSASEALIEAIEVLQGVGDQRPAETAGRLRSLMDRLTAADESDLATNPETKVASLERVVRSVAFFFCKQPLLFADPMNTALLTYLAIVVRFGRDVDRELLRPVVAIVEQVICEGSG